MLYEMERLEASFKVFPLDTLDSTDGIAQGLDESSAGRPGAVDIETGGQDLLTLYRQQNKI